VGYTIELDDVYEEGQLFKARHLFQAGERVDDVWDHIFENTRTPDLNNGDIEAIISATRAGADRYLDWIEQKGLETVQAVEADLLDYAESMMRNEIGTIPDGTYQAESYLDDDGVHRAKPLKVDVRATIDGSEITVDLSDSADQVPTAYNVPFRGSTKVAIYFTLRAILLDTYTHDEWIPENSGSFASVSTPR
jgi:N-methylhydantoinase B